MLPTGIWRLGLRLNFKIMVLRKKDAGRPYFQTLMSILRAKRFQHELACLNCCNLTHTGSVVRTT